MKFIMPNTILYFFAFNIMMFLKKKNQLVVAFFTGCILESNIYNHLYKSTAFVYIYSIYM